MDLATLNKMISEHLRHYGYQVAARIVESEIKANASRIVDKPSKLFDLVIKPNQNQNSESLMHHNEFLSISTKTPESSTKSDNKSVNGIRTYNGSQDYDITSFKPDAKRPPQLTNTADNEKLDTKDFQNALRDKVQHPGEASVTSARDYPHQNDFKINTKRSDGSYKYGEPTQDYLNKTRGRGFIDSHPINHQQSTRLPLLDTSRNSSTVYTPPPRNNINNQKHSYSLHKNPHSHGIQNDEEEDQSQKVKDPNDLNRFIPYSYNPLTHKKNNDSNGHRSLSVPESKEQLYEQEFHHDQQHHNHRHLKPQPPSEYMVPRMTNPLKPISNANNKSHVANKSSGLDEEFQRPRSLHPTSLDYSILSREAELLPAAAEINARHGIPQKPIIKKVEQKHGSDNFLTDHKETKELKTSRVNTIATPTKVDRPEHNATIKEPSDPNYIPFRKPEGISHGANKKNPLIKNTHHDSERNQLNSTERETHAKDSRTKGDDRNQTMSSLSIERQSLIVFKPSTNNNDKSDNLKQPSTQLNKEIFTPTHNRIDFLKDFGDSNNKQSKHISNQMTKAPEEQKKYHVSDSFGPENWEKAQQTAQNQLYRSPIPQNNSEKAPPRQASNPNENNFQHFNNMRPPRRELSDREHEFDPFDHTFHANKSKLPNSEDLVDMYDHNNPEHYNTEHHNVDLSHKTLEYLKNTTKLTEKEIRENFNAYVQVVNPKVNPELLMNREKFIEYMRMVRGITSPTFSETCFNFAITSFTNERDTEYITYREAGHLLDLMHPGHPYAFMKLLFKLYQGDEEQVKIRELEAPLRGITSGPLYEIALLLRSSLDYLYERLRSTDVKLSFEEYLGYMQDYEPIKIYN